MLERHRGEFDPNEWMENRAPELIFRPEVETAPPVAPVWTGGPAGSSNPKWGEYQDAMA